MTKQKVTAEVMTVTPAMAKKWLANSTNFRRLRDVRVDRLAQVIEKGFWDLNGESIKLNGDHTLKDGQHRLAAVVKANKSIQTVVVRGIDTDLNIDIGRNRTFGEWLRFHEEPNAYRLAAAIRFVWNYRNGVFKARGGMRQLAPSHRELLVILKQNPTIRDSVSTSWMEGRMLPSAVAGGLHFLFAKKSVSLADDFVAGLRGELVVETKDDPVDRLRVILLKDTRARDHMSSRHKAALCIKAWNFWREGKGIQSLRFIASGTSKEKFPTIK